MKVISPYPLEYATDGSAAVDLRANHDWAFKCDALTWAYPGDKFDIPTGVYLDMRDSGMAAIVLPRSGLGSKGLVLRNTVGLIDSDYQGEIILKMEMRGDNPIKIERGDRIAQLLFIPIIRPSFEYVSSFESSTGRGGFGSTGV